ncbi:fatty acyl-CoA reductase wat-like [Vespula squamosa]|uniref:Fatty acyl-CoA reductase wat-like n=1 Tax=Vespula squamosa TaxID=30214 RepID=A0ABD2C9C6_VESSQ
MKEKLLDDMIPYNTYSDIHVPETNPEIDKMHEPIDITASGLMGLIRIHYCDGSIKVDFVPGDLTANGIIANS